MEHFGSWSILTTNFLVVLYLALGGAILPVILHLANGRWRFQIRFLSGVCTALFPVAFALLLVLLFNGEKTFPWLAAGRAGQLKELSGWLDYPFLVGREIVGFAIVAGLSIAATRCQYLSESNPRRHFAVRFHVIAMVMPFVYVTYGTMIAWDFEMTLQPGWHSAAYGVYQFQSAFHGFLGFFVILLYFLDHSGRLTRPFEEKIYNYMAQFILAMSILWVYFYFTQFLIFWYGRLPGDMDRYLRMIEQGYLPLGIVFLFLKFILPFCIFIFTRARHDPAIVMLVGLGVVLGTWIERYVWISGSVASRYYHVPFSSIFDVAVTVAVGAASWLTINWALRHWWLIRPET